MPVAPTPPAMSTSPVWSAVAVWKARAVAICVACVRNTSTAPKLAQSLAGQKASAVWSGVPPLPMPPVMSTAPVDRRAAACPKRAVCIGPCAPAMAPPSALPSGVNRSPLLLGVGEPPVPVAPPARRMRPSTSAVAVWKKRPTDMFGPDEKTPETSS